MGCDVAGGAALGEAVCEAGEVGKGGAGGAGGEGGRWGCGGMESRGGGQGTTLLGQRRKGRDVSEGEFRSLHVNGREAAS